MLLMHWRFMKKMVFIGGSLEMAVLIMLLSQEFFFIWGAGGGGVLGVDSTAF
jgi:hypothetical protein